MLLLKRNIAILLMVMSSCLVFAKPTIDYCQTCLNLSEFIQEMEHNQTESIMKQNLYKMCLKENDGSNSRTCLFLSTTMHNTIKQIANRDFCTKINACSSGKPINKLVPHHSERCEFCTNLLESFKSLVAESNLNLVKESLSYYCELTNDFKDECQKNIDNNLVNFIDFIQNKVDSQEFCHAINSCDLQIPDEKKVPSIGDLVALRDPIQIADYLDFIEQQEKFSSFNSNDLKNPISCLVCKQVVVLVYAKLQKGATREHVEEVLAKSCKAIYPRNKSKERDCESKVEKNAEIIMKGFINKVPPTVVCILIGMCLPGQKVEEQDEIYDLKGLKSMLTKDIKSDWCKVCKFTYPFLHLNMRNAVIKYRVRDILFSYCNMKENGTAHDCREKMYKYIETIEKVSDKEIGCNEINLCKPNEKVDKISEVETLAKAISKSNSVKDIIIIDYCKICQASYPVLSKYVQDKSAKEEAKSAGYKFCDLIDIKDFKKGCKPKIDQIIETVVTVQDTEEGCRKLSFCTIKQLQKISTNSSYKPTQMAQSFKCYFCDKIVEFLFKELDQTKTREYIKYLLNKSCLTLFKNEDRESECQEYVNAYTDKLINLIEKAENPGLICNALHMCPVNSSMVNAWDEKRLNTVIKNELKKSFVMNISMKDGPVVKLDWCNICKVAFPVLNEALQIDEVNDNVRFVSYKFCDKQILPIKDCKAKVDKYINVFTTIREADVGCKILTFCPETKVSFSINADLQVIDLASIDPSFDEEILNKTLEQIGWFDDAKCSACKILVKGVYANLEHTIHNPATKEMINQACDHIHQDELKEECKQDVYKALEELFNDLTKSLPPQEMCELLKYCKKNSVTNFPTTLKHLAENSACNTCKSLFPFLHRMLQNEDVRKNVKKILLNICDYSKKPVKCKIASNKLIDNLSDNETPDLGCFSLCQETYFTSSIRNLTECTTCQISMEVIDETFKNSHVQLLLNKSLDTFCNSLEDKFQSPCKTMVKNNLPKLYQMVKSLVDHDSGFCVSTGICKPSKKVISIINSDIFSNEDLLKGAEELIPNEDELLNDSYSISSKSLICDECKLLMGRVHDEIVNNKECKDKILRMLLKTCPEKDDKCREFYHKYVNYFYDMLKRNTNPDKVCPAMKLCANDFELFEPLNAELVLPTNPNDTTICEECKSAVQYLAKTINDPKVVDFILKEVDQNVCQPLSLIEKKACNRFVKEFGPKIIKHFTSKIDKQLICNKELRLCKDNSFKDQIILSIDNADDESLDNSYSISSKSLICDECKLLMGRVHDEIVNNRECKDKILRMLLKTCPEKDDKCREFYHKYVNYFYDILKRNTNPDKVCPAMKLCANDFELFEPLNAELVLSTNPNDTKICEECKSFVQYLAKTINDPKVVDFILKEVDQNVCQPLSLIEKKACNRFVKEFGPKIIKHFTSKIDKQLICNKELRLCKDNSFKDQIILSIDNANDEISFDLINFLEDPNCIVCIRSVGKLNKLRGDSKNNFTVEEICKDDGECSEFMFNFLDFFLNNDHNRDPTIACTELDVCLIPGKVQVIGGDKCKYGPKYSCLSVAHSEACKATEFCKQHYWKAVEN